MALFYFDVLKGEDIARDLEGTELPCLEDAKALARLTARELLADAIKAGQQSPEVVAISDENGRKLAEIAVMDVLPKL